jgi:hypothetical protein
MEERSGGGESGERNQEYGKCPQILKLLALSLCYYP